MALATFDLATFEASTGAARAAQAAKLDGICKDIGFLVLTGHGIETAKIAAMWGAVDAFFAQDSDAKARFS